ncbi:cell division protein FtsQ/DivIB [Nonlabens sp.]|uniref:cell division protein FtsQ/DivIB n=1 Tax=Nonlabens sp. TaxID=1888209 RepID=UPI003F699B56
MSVRNLLKVVLCTVLIFSAYAFASHRFDKRNIKDVTISYTDSKALFISEKNVNKLLIQNVDSAQTLAIENLDLNRGEKSIVENAMVRDAVVSVSLDGRVNVLVEQRTPIARLISPDQMYLDSDNKLMPLSQEHTAFVPLVYGYKDSLKNALFTLVNFINDDPFLKPAVTQISFDKKGVVTLEIRAHDYEVIWGEVKDLEHKAMNYKAFIAKMEKDKRLNQIKTIDLRYKNQVVSIKK